MFLGGGGRLVPQSFGNAPSRGSGASERSLKRFVFVSIPLPFYLRLFLLSIRTGTEVLVLSAVMRWCLSCLVVDAVKHWSLFFWVVGRVLAKSWLLDHLFLLLLALVASTPLQHCFDV